MVPAAKLVTVLVLRVGFSPVSASMHPGCVQFASTTALSVPTYNDWLVPPLPGVQLMVAIFDVAPLVMLFITGVVALQVGQVLQ